MANKDTVPTHHATSFSPSEPWKGLSPDLLKRLGKNHFEAVTIYRVAEERGISDFDKSDPVWGYYYTLEDAKKSKAFEVFEMVSIQILRGFLYNKRDFFELKSDGKFSTAPVTPRYPDDVPAHNFIRDLNDQIEVIPFRYIGLREGQVQG